jgi:hypothetical protein
MHRFNTPHFSLTMENQLLRIIAELWISVGMMLPWPRNTLSIETHYFIKTPYSDYILEHHFCPAEQPGNPQWAAVL